MSAWTDPHDPIRHDTGGEQAERAIIARHEKWLKLHPELAYLFCEHGSYIGYNGALRYRAVCCS